MQGSEHICSNPLRLKRLVYLTWIVVLYFRTKPVDFSREDQNPYNILVVFHALGSRPKTFHTRKISIKTDVCISLYDVNNCVFPKEYAVNVRLDDQTHCMCLMVKSFRVNGGAYRDRTDDPLLAKQVLSQLS